jgi:hypothetical protein
MTTTRDDDVDKLIEAVMRRGPSPPGAAAGPCPSENALAALAEGALLPEERESVERHVAGCGECLDVVASLARELPTPVAAERPARHGAARFLPLAAAILLAAIGLMAWRALRGGGSTAEMLVASAQQLSSSRPDLFGDFQPLRSDELAQRGDVRVRGGTRLHAPAGTILETRPTFEWDTSRGAGARRVEVLDASGNVVVDAQCGSPCSYSTALAPLQEGGRYTWRLTIEGPFGSETTSLGFSVASASDRADFDAASAEIDRVVPEGVRDLLRAHLALRRDLRTEATRFAQRHVDAAPDDELGRQTLAHARALQGYDD